MPAEGMMQRSVDGLQDGEAGGKSSAGKASKGCQPTPSRVPERRTWIEVATSTQALQHFIDLWDDLAQSAVEPNVFYEHWQLLPALSAFGEQEDFVFLFVMHVPAETGAIPSAIGFFPMCRLTRLRGWPVRMLSMWTHDFGPLSTPLLRAGQEREAWQAMLAWAASPQSRAHLVEFPLLSGDGLVNQALIDVLYERQYASFVLESFTRAIIAPGTATADTYIERTISSGVRKELRRQRRRLDEGGVVVARALGPADDVSPWLDDFFSLEASGWKGEAETVIASCDGLATYFRSICLQAHARGRLHMLGLFQAGKALAMKCNFLAGEGAFALKIAYDQAYARFSPGSQLELENIIDIRRFPEIRWMDSCAVPTHPMINRLWGERRVIKHLIIAPRGPGGEFFIGLLTCLRAGKRGLAKLFKRKG
jgi:CelD/BcsL family acetyltransferase involved in cellulose biosynthesis